MKHEIVSILIALGLLVGLAAIPAQAVTEEEIELSIESGLDWLVPLQNLADSDSPLYGSWGDEDMVARTGLAVLKLESHALETGKDPFDAGYEDSQNSNGSWPRDIWGDEITSTEWALLTLERVAPPPSIIEVEIDIKPGSWPNSINPDSKGVIPVAILTTDDFDATTVDPDTVAFGPAGATAVRYALEDVDDDDDIDIILHFKTQEVGLSAEDTEATLTGQTFDGQRIKGTDAVRIAPR